MTTDKYWIPRGYAPR